MYCEKLRYRKPRKRLANRLNKIALDCAALPDFDTRSPDEIIGYDENGMWSNDGDFAQTDIATIY